jgi:acetyltransferase
MASDPTLRPSRTGGGGSIVVRRISPSDHDALRDFYAGLSDESRRSRFFGVTPGIGARQSTWFCSPDRGHREGLVAIAGRRPGRPDRIVGHVCVEPIDETTAEIAVAVDDRFQGCGIGRRLVDAAVVAARADGYERLVATMLSGNPAIQRLLLGLGLPAATRAIGAGVVEATIDLRELGRLCPAA